MKKGNQDAFIEVKKEMLACLQENREFYMTYLSNEFAEIDVIEKALSFALSGEVPDFCPSDYWFVNPGCSQIAADTYKRPVAVYSSRFNKDRYGEYCDTPLLFLPFKEPKDKLSPIVMQFVGRDHWSTVKIRRPLTIEWPVIHWPLIDACKAIGDSRDLRKHVWRNLKIKKPVYREPSPPTYVEHE